MKTEHKFIWGFHAVAWVFIALSYFSPADDWSYTIWALMILACVVLCGNKFHKNEMARNAIRRAKSFAEFKARIAKSIEDDPIMAAWMEDMTRQGREEMEEVNKARAA